MSEPITIQQMLNDTPERSLRDIAQQVELANVDQYDRAGLIQALLPILTHLSQQA